MTTNYSLVISYATLQLQEFDHDTGASIRSLCQGNRSWSPFYSTEFDPVTGLPLAFALGSTDVQNPCGLAADASSFYLLDPMTVRVLRFLPNTGQVIATFGGKRGIGAGRITPDSLKRSICTVANGFFWLTDNQGGFIVQYDLFGNWLADYSLADWAAATSLSFDQCTGLTWDNARGHYWALVQGTGNCYVIRINSAGTALATGSLDLTAQAGIPGHAGSPAGRVLTRGLRSFAGYLYLWSGAAVYRANPADGAALLLTDAAGTAAPGCLSDDGAKLIYSSTNQSNGGLVVVEYTLATGATRAYAPAAIPATGAVGFVSDPWEIIVSPLAGDTSARLLQTVQAKARLLGTHLQSIQAKANLFGKTTQVVQGKARIIQGSQRQAQSLARIDIAGTPADGTVYEWEVTDSFGDFSRAFQINYRTTSNLQVGYQVGLWGGYDTNRVQLINGVVDEVTKETNPNALNYVASGRDFGAREIQSIRITNTWYSIPTVTMPTAQQIIRDTAAALGIGIGVLEFPDYSLYNTYVAVGRTILDIISELLEPWNLFGRIQYSPIIRDKTISIIKIDWQNPPSGGCVLTRAYDSQQNRHQELYLDQPRLVEVQFLFVKGAAYKRPAINLGVQTNVEYQRNIVSTNANDTFAGQVNDKSGGSGVGKIGGANQSMDTTTEITTVTTSYCDKLLTRVEKQYNNSNGAIVTGVVSESTSGLLQTEETRESYFYINGGDPSLQIAASDFIGTPIQMSAGDIEVYSTLPDQNALLWIVANRHWGIVDAANGTEQFIEESRAITQYYYDKDQKVAAEITVSQTFNTETGAWGVTTLTKRTHSPTTGNSLRTNLSTFTYDNSKFKISTVDRQLIAGTRVDFRAVNPRGCLVTVQAETPQIFDLQGHLVDPSQGNFIWSYDNAYLGQTETDAVYQTALTEQAFQRQNYRWEVVTAVAALTPGLHHGQPVSIEIETGIFRDYWVETLVHRSAVDHAQTVLTCKRLTLEDLP
jgi:hypothetical protein